DVPIGIKGSQAAQAVRPYLQEQSAVVSKMLFGDYKKKNERLDFYFGRGSDDEPYIFFIAPEDLSEGMAYSYERPGFFASPSLAPDSKISATQIEGVGDVLHEKLAITPGETMAYFEDDSAQVWRVRFIREDGGGGAIRVGVSQRLHD